MNSLNLTLSTPHTLTIPHHACEISPCCQCVKCFAFVIIIWKAHVICEMFTLMIFLSPWINIFSILQDGKFIYLILHLHTFLVASITCRIYYSCSNRSRAAIIVSDIHTSCDNDRNICIKECDDKRDEIARKIDTSIRIILVLSRLILAIFSFNNS